MAMDKVAMDKAYKQLPARGDQQSFAVVALKNPTSGRMGGFIPKTQLFGATIAVLNYNTVSRVMATVAARWLEIPRTDNFDDFGTITTESAIQEASKAFTV